ncbi:MAG: ABC transporter substrate-binding protein [Synergistaceae bacterium]|jgi:NitT/TauT family transport system substrate-binding protein|nr:ABC transporter substrate-binding protein [Synergistaceae bacterium]
MSNYKKIFLTLLCCAILSSCAVLSNGPETPAYAATPEDENAAWQREEAAGRTIRIGYDGGICLATTALAHIKGFFAEEGLKTELVRTPQGEQMRDAVGSGKIDTAGYFIAAWAVPVVNGINMQFVAGANTGCQSLYVLAGSPYKTTADLKGKTIAVPNGIGNSSHNISLRFLGHDGLDPGDFNFSHVETGAVTLAMQRGEIDAATMSDQFAKKFVQDGTLRVIRSITYDDDFSHEACCVFAINGDFIRANPITAKKLTRAFKKAGKWYQHNKEEAVRILLDQGWTSGDYDYCLTLAGELNFDISWKDTEATLRSVVKDYKTFGLISAGKTDDEIMKIIWNPSVDDDDPVILRYDPQKSPQK